MEIDPDTKLRERAYALWEERGRPSGSSDQDWLRAERELRAAERPVAERPKRSRAAPASKAAPAKGAAPPRSRGEGSRPSRGA